ncbi:MAG: DUF3574 domain-containing protein [Methylomonas sp.]
MLFGWLIAVGGCANGNLIRCQGNERFAIADTLYFGGAQPQGAVSPEEWRDFIAASVAPRFPQGYTAWPAQGQWRNAAGVVLQENTYVLQLLHADDVGGDRAVAELANSYKTRFRQEAVLRVRTGACMGF